MRRSPVRNLLLMLILMPTLATAAGLKDFAGAWAMRLGQRNLFVLTLALQDGKLSGSWERPMKFSGTSGAFANMSGAIRQDKVVDLRLAGGVLHFKVQNGSDPGN